MVAERAKRAERIEGRDRADIMKETAETPNTSGTATITESTAMRHTAKVLLIEDDEGTRETMHFILTDAGYEVFDATNAMDGHAFLLAAQEPLVVVLDYRLPAMDGCDLLGIVAHDAALREQHAFVMVTASPRKTMDDCEETLDELDVPVLGKPFDIDDLLAAVEEAQRRVGDSSEASA